MIADVVVTLRTPALTVIMRMITALGGLATLTVLILMFATWLVCRDRRAHALFVSLSMMLGAGPLVHGLKHLVGRVRPADALIDLPGTSSFPSGHAFAALLFAGLVMVVTTESGGTTGQKRWMWVLLVLAMLVGVSRVYLGVHWASDVIAGWALAGIWFGASTAVFRAWDRHALESRGRA